MSFSVPELSAGPQSEEVEALMAFLKSLNPESEGLLESPEVEDPDISRGLNRALSALRAYTVFVNSPFDAGISEDLARGLWDCIKWIGDDDHFPVLELLNLHMRDDDASRNNQHAALIDSWKAKLNVLSGTKQNRFLSRMESLLDHYSDCDVDEIGAIMLHAYFLYPLERSPANYVKMCQGLAQALWAVFRRGEDEKFLPICLQMEATIWIICPPDYPGRSSRCFAFAESLRIRFTRTSDLTTIDHAVKLGREAVQASAGDNSNRAILHAGLARSLWTHFEYTGDRASFDEVAETAKGHPDCAEYISMGLILALRRRFERIGDPALLDEATDLVDEALLLYLPSHPSRWRSLRQLAKITLVWSDFASQRESLGRYSMTSDPTPESLGVFTLAFRGFQNFNLEAPAASLLERLLDDYSYALELTYITAGFAPALSVQLNHSISCSELGIRAYMLAQHLNMPYTALQVLERARGVIWAQFQQLRRPEYRNAPPHIASRLSYLIRAIGRDTHELFSLEDGDKQAFDTRQPFLNERRLVLPNDRRIRELLMEIRVLPGLDDFMCELDLPEVDGSSVWNPVVILVSSGRESHALVIDRLDKLPVTIPLYGIVPQDLTLTKATLSQRGATQSSPEDQRLIMQISKARPPSAALDLLAKLWHKIAKPVIAKLGLTRREGPLRPRIHWCATGAFAFVPIHAAGVYDGPHPECCSDYVISSYTPTLAALLRAREDARVYKADQLKMLVIAVQDARDSDFALPRLSCVRAEAASIVDVTSKAGISVDSAAESASREEVSVLFNSKNMVHLACHGIQHPTLPHTSRFCLKDGSLTVLDLMKMELKDAFFAFLSACETAKGDVQHADESIHLAAAMLFAGFKSVVATMWAMNDVDGPEVARLFYEKLFQHETLDADVVPYALDHAVAALRKSGAPPERWATFVHMGA